MRDRWLTHMRDAVDSLDLPDEQRPQLWTYLERAAYFMVNQPGAERPGDDGPRGAATGAAAAAR